MKGKGFTLIEVLVTSILLVLLIGSSLIIYVNQQKIVLNNERRYHAQRLLRSYLDPALATGGLEKRRPFVLNALLQAKGVTASLGSKSFELPDADVVTLFDGSSLDYKTSFAWDEHIMDVNGIKDSVMRVEATTTWATATGSEESMNITISVR